MGIFDRKKPDHDRPPPRQRRYVLEIDVADPDTSASDLILLYQDADLIFESSAARRAREAKENHRKV